MFNKINKTKKSFIVAIGMSLVLLMASAFGFLLETRVGQITKPVGVDLWSSYTSTPTGSGTSANPYKVKTPNQLAWFLNNGSNSYIVLESDIDLAEHTWSGIPNGKVTNFDGLNHTIFNLNGTQGLFASSPTVKNLRMSNVNISSSGSAGAVCSGGTITNCTVTSGTIQGTSTVGGIASGAGTITGCTNNATVIGTGSYVGGIVGNNAGSALDCINTGDVYGTSYVGGIGGAISYVKNCYAECTVSGSTNVGGILGKLLSGGYTLESSGFNGKLIINGTSPSNIGSLIGATSGGYIKNDFGIAEINLLQTTDTSVVNEFGVDRRAALSASSTYAYSKVFTMSGVKELRKYKFASSETNPFSQFAYHKNINGGYPFVRSLFAVGQYIECDTPAYLKEYGFDNMLYNFVKKGDYWYYEFGEYPQTYVGDSLNNSLKSWFANSKPTRESRIFRNDTGTSGTVTNYAYKYIDGNTYVRVASSLQGSSLAFQDNTIIGQKGGEYWFKIEPINWWVLNYEEVKKNKANPILLAKQGLTASVTWNKLTSDSNLWSGSCNVRTWLNNSFLFDAFPGSVDNESDRIFIKTTTVKNNSQSSLTDGTGTTTNDKIWLLSYNEANTFFTTYKQRLCTPTDYAIAHNSSLTTNASYPTDLRPNGGTSNYWLRSADISKTNYACMVSSFGSLSNISINYVYSTVRPALTLNI